MRIPNFVIAAVAIVVAVIVGGYLCQALGFGKDPNVHCYGARC